MLERAYNALIAAGLDARLATMHAGVCTAPYYVVYEGQPDCGRTVIRRRILIDVLVPAAKPGLLPEAATAARSAMESVGCRLSEVSPTAALDDYKAVNATMEFTALCSL